MKTIQQYSTILILLICCTACQESKLKTAENIVREWTGKEVVLPEVPCMYMGRDTICPPPSAKPYKVLVYTDSVGCTSCQLNLGLWQIYMEDAEAIAPGRVDFLFYFQPKNEKELSYLLRRERVEHRVFVDADSRLQQANDFPEGMAYQCFLLDGDNKVLSIGNPTVNPQIWDIYKKLFTE